MNKENQPETGKKPRGKYDDKLKVKGSFLDIVKASVKDAKAKTDSKNKKKKEE
jgi:hypothetical protein